MIAYKVGIEKQNSTIGKQPAVGKTHIIGIAEHKIVKAPDKVSTLGLGSCVGLVLYDSVKEIAGMVHIMMPSAPKNNAAINKSKFADTAVSELVRLMIQSGSKHTSLVAKLAGGAHMFSGICNSDIMNIGERNVQICKKHLQHHAIRIAAEDTGSTCGRSIEFCCITGKLQVRTVTPRNIKFL